MARRPQAKGAEIVSNEIFRANPRIQKLVEREAQRRKRIAELKAQVVALRDEIEKETGS